MFKEETKSIFIGIGDERFELEREPEEAALLEEGEYMATITSIGRENGFRQPVLAVIYDVDTEAGVFELKDLVFVNATLSGKLKEFLLAVYDGEIPQNPKLDQDPIGLSGRIKLEIRTTQDGRRKYNYVVAWDFSAGAGEVEDIEFDED